MKVEIKRVDKELPLPQYETDGACGFDLVLREGATIDPHGYALLPTNVIVKVPQGYMLAVMARSSLNKKTGLIIPHGFGVLDQDYHGPEDEAKLLVYNPTSESIEVKRGDRLGQGVFIRVDMAEWEEIEGDFKTESRGGFGSTG
ncbi:MAG: dUTP diphosphatase [Patescibacteria group bacterium]